MSDIARLGDLDIKGTLLGLMVILFAFVTLCLLIKNIAEIIKKPVKAIKENAQQTIDIQAIKERQVEMEDKLNTLTDIVIDDRAERMRYEILELASSIAAGQRVTLEQIRHVSKVYDDYEEFLAKHHRQNSEVEMSIKIVREEFERLLKGE